MKKRYFAILAVLAAAAALGLSAFSYASAASPSGIAASFTAHPGRGPGGNGPEGDHPLQPYIEAAAAEALGMSVEDLQAAKEDGVRMGELLDEAGLTQEEFQAAMEGALPGILEQAVEDGAITQEQADQIAENGFPGPRTHRGHGPKGFGPLSEYIEAATAEALGMSVEDLQAAREDGVRMDELLDEAGLTQEEFQAAMEDALPGILEQAVEDGVITQEQADDIAENGFRRPGGCDGRGRKGPGGEQAPEDAGTNF